MVTLGAWLLLTSLSGIIPVALLGLLPTGHDAASVVFGVLGVVAVLVAIVTMVALRAGGRSRAGEGSLDRVRTWTRFVGVGSVGCAAATLVASHLISPWSLPFGQPVTMLNGTEWLSALRCSAC